MVSAVAASLVAMVLMRAVFAVSLSYARQLHDRPDATANDRRLVLLNYLFGIGGAAILVGYASQ
jgi:hypothetical protein